MDLCQSVLGELFREGRRRPVRAGIPGRIDGSTARDDVRNKVYEKARKRHEHQLGASEPIATGEDPQGSVLNTDFLNEFRRRLKDDERFLWDRRNLGEPWQSIAAELATSPESLRQKYSRAIHVVARELGLEEVE